MIYDDKFVCEILVHGDMHDPKYDEAIQRNIQRQVGEALLPRLWNAGKYVVDVTTRTESVRSHPSYYLLALNAPEAFVLRAEATITKVQDWRVVYYHAGPEHIPQTDEATVWGMLRELMDKLHAKAKPTLRGFFPWQYYPPEHRPRPQSPLKRRLRRLMTDLAVWSF